MIRTGLAAVMVPLAAIGTSPALQASSGSRGYVWMFLLMASMPYLLLVVIGGGLYRARRREVEREVRRELDRQREWELSGDAPGALNPTETGDVR